MIRIFCLLLLLCPYISNAQAPIIKGTITDARSGVPIEGITIRAALNNKTTISQPNGTWQLSLPRLPDTIYITGTAYNSTIIPVTDHSTIVNIKLEPAPNTLQEVSINSGYQTFNRRNATGSYSTVGNQLLNQRVSTGILQRLDGLAPALRVDRRAGAEAPTQLRGLSSLLPNTTSPLIIVDNFPYDEDINTINPADVENITILKDAAAAAIWGARAGNGVIVITTKTGNFSKPLAISLSSTIKAQPVPNIAGRRTMSPGEILEVETFLFDKGFYNNDITNSINYPALTPWVETLQKVRNGSITPQAAAEANNNFRQNDVRRDIEKYLYRTALYSQHSLSLSWGSGKTKVYSSLGFDNNLESQRGNDYKRLTAKIELTTNLNSKIQWSTGITFSNQQSTANSPGTYNSFFIGSKQLPVYASLVDNQGNTVPIALRYRAGFTDTVGAGKLLNWNYNPLDELRAADRQTKSNNFMLNNGIRINLLKGLNIEGRAQLQYNSSNSENYRSKKNFYTRDLINSYTAINGSTVNYGIPNEGILDASNSSTITKALRGQVNYTHSYKNVHEITALAAAEIRETNTETANYRNYGYNKSNSTSTPVDYITYFPTYNNIGGILQVPYQNDSRRTNMRFVSLVSSVNYTYKAKYTLAASARKDAANIFGVNTNQKGTPLWSVGGLWKLSEEGFYKLNGITKLHLRGSYGFAGSFSPDVSAKTILQYYPANFTIINLPVTGISSTANPNLRWQKVGTTNLGFDMATVGDRLRASVEWYTKKTVDLLGTQTLDPTTGVSSMITNSADITGQGVDLDLNYAWVRNKLNWNTSLLFSYVTNRVTKLKRNTPDAASSYISDGFSIKPLQGIRPYSILAYRWGGLNASGMPQGYIADTLTTDYRLLQSTPSSQLINKGQAIPPFFGVLRNEFTYRNFSLSLSISYRLGYWFNKNTISYTALAQSLQPHPDYGNRWKKPGDEKTTSVPAFLYPVSPNMDAFYRFAEINVLRADNIKFDWFTVAYQLVPTGKMKARVGSIRVFLNADNLNGIIWKANKQGLDPDFQYNVKTPPAYTLGFNINLK